MVWRDQIFLLDIVFIEVCILLKYFSLYYVRVCIYWHSNVSFRYDFAIFLSMQRTAHVYCSRFSIKDKNIYASLFLLHFIWGIALCRYRVLKNCFHPLRLECVRVHSDFIWKLVRSTSYLCIECDIKMIRIILFLWCFYKTIAYEEAICNVYYELYTISSIVSVILSERDIIMSS